MLLFPPLSPSPPHSCPAEVFHTLHPYGRLVQPCPAWSTTHSLQKDQELKPQINVSRRIINQAMSHTGLRGKLTPELCNSLHTPRVFFLLCCSPPAEALFLFFHSSLFLNFTMWSSQECFPLSLQSLPPSLARSLSMRSRDHSFTQLFWYGGVSVCMCVCPCPLLCYVTLICPPSALKQRS